jgi:hypothetical protein
VKDLLRDLSPMTKNEQTVQEFTLLRFWIQFVCLKVLQTQNSLRRSLRAFLCLRLRINNSQLQVKRIPRSRVNMNSYKQCLCIIFVRLSVRIRYTILVWFREQWYLLISLLTESSVSNTVAWYVEAGK